MSITSYILLAKRPKIKSKIFLKATQVVYCITQERDEVKVLSANKEESNTIIIQEKSEKPLSAHFRLLQSLL